MDIASVSSTSNSLASLASNMQAGNIGRQISVSVLKGVLDSQQQAGQALVQMIQGNTLSLNGSGKIIDVRA